MEAKAPMMLRPQFQAGGRISIDHKDLKNVLATAHELDIPILMSTPELFEMMQGLKCRA